MLEEHATERTVTLAVAALSDRATIEGLHHLLALSQIWTRSPFENPFTSRLRSDAAVWQHCLTVGVPIAHLIPSGKSLDKQNDHISNEDEAAIKFSSYMSTTLFLLMLLESAACVSTQKGTVLPWVFNVLSFLIGMLPPLWRVRLGPVSLTLLEGTLPSHVVYSLVHNVFCLLREWQAPHQHDQDVELHAISSRDDTPIHFGHFVYSLFRRVHANATVRGAVKELVHAIAKKLDAAFPSHLLDAPSPIATSPRERPTAPEGPAG